MLKIEIAITASTLRGKLTNCSNNLRLKGNRLNGTSCVFRQNSVTHSAQRKYGRPIKSKSKTNDCSETMSKLVKMRTSLADDPVFLITTTLITNVPAFLSFFLLPEEEDTKIAFEPFARSEPAKASSGFSQIPGHICI